ncbi:MAG: histone deacetylase family protein [Candidatus Binatia bacterium]
MARTAVVVDKEYLKHQPGESHPERPERVKVLLDLAAELDRAQFQLLAPKPAKRADIEAIHSKEYVGLIEATSAHNSYALDGDTITCRDSFGVSVLAVGGLLNLIDAIAAKEVQNGFALVRPPGHHALRNRAMGFCLFNTMAIAAEYVKRAHGAKRVMIMDWDVHHGNGTQDAFYDDPSVLFISTHQFPYYPGCGALNEVGAGAGAGFTINIPLPAGCADAEYRQVFQDIIIPVAERFEPDWILVSAGFDPHRRDPLGGMGVTEEGFAAMAQRLLAVAEKFSSTRAVFLLEGGYDLVGLKNSVAAVLDAMQRPDRQLSTTLNLSESRIEPLIRRIQQVHEKYNISKSY